MNSRGTRNLCQKSRLCKFSELLIFLDEAYFFNILGSFVKRNCCVGQSVEWRLY
jgi:hypothetical protein